MVLIDAKVMVGWVWFLSIYTLVWNASIGSMMRLASSATSRATPEQPMRRADLFMIGVYVACRAALLVTLYMLLCFCVMSCMQCVLPFLKHLHCFHAAMTWLFAEDVLFQPLKPNLLPFHAAVMVSSLWLATVCAVVSASDADLRVPERSQSVVVREALCMPVLGVCAYLGMALFQSTITQS